MKRLFVVPAILLIAALSLNGCASKRSSATAPAAIDNSPKAPDGSKIERSFSLKEIKVSIPSLLVVQKSKRPFYIVLDPAKIKDAYYPKVAGAWGRMATAELKHFHDFVRRDLVKVLQDQFETVTVVGPGFTPPESAAWIADVKVDDVDVLVRPMGTMTFSNFEMQWSFAVRAPEQNEYLASYAFKSTSSNSYRDFREGASQMLDSAVSGFLKALTEKNSNDISILQILTKAPASNEPAKTAEEKALEESI
ncbi:MAG: hypothetical protein LBM75_09100 [Myxococcales bacterium]|jgi:hypothetical protein|nr:hypothetical protein [Myxococcales bacterium]